jgi:F-type H+-transporting ATPase subunit gamma
MATLRDIRRRIASVKSTQQITRAMKMVAAAKLRRAQERILASRPYASRMREIIRSVALRADPTTHPLLTEREVKKVDLIVITADKGLCGAFNANVMKRAALYLEDNAELSPTLICVGKKGRDYFSRRGKPIAAEFIDVFRAVGYDSAMEIAGQAVERFLSGETDRVDIVFNRFKSVMTQEVAIETLVPIPPLDINEGEVVVDFLYEPDPKSIIDALIPKDVETQVYTTLLESQAGELGARMTAMDSATNNAVEMIGSLTLHYNKVRQGAITTELIEIVSGAEALQG